MTGPLVTIAIASVVVAAASVWRAAQGDGAIAVGSTAVTSPSPAGSLVELPVSAIPPALMASTPPSVQPASSGPPILAPSAPASIAPPSGSIRRLPRVNRPTGAPCEPTYFDEKGIKRYDPDCVR
jgi:hypothetical protein